MNDLVIKKYVLGQYLLYINGIELKSRDIYDYPNYRIFENGTVINKNTGFILKQNKCSSEYLKVDLYKDSKRRTCYIHRLVAQAFHVNFENKKRVLHIDNNKLNNHKSNVFWC